MQLFHDPAYCLFAFVYINDFNMYSARIHLLQWWKDGFFSPALRL